jgi:formamidopyrimidine-DNA glycosylase
MPEISEVRICADFINSHTGNLLFWKEPEKSEVSKVKMETSLPLPYTMKASSRGKELLIDLYPLEDDSRLWDSPVRILVTLGMSGNFSTVRSVLPIASADLPKHSHLAFHGKVVSKGMNSNGFCSIVLVDPRRFAKWRWARGFSANRGPDPVQEHQEFRDALLKRIRDDKDFSSRTLAEALLDQASFNGIGNYLRSTILFHLEKNPFLSLSQLADDEKAMQKMIVLCKEIPEFFYKQKGGQLRDWKNPFGEGGDFREVLFYQRGESLYDSGKRRFWYDPKWKDSEEHQEYLKTLSKG